MGIAISSLSAGERLGVRIYYVLTKMGILLQNVIQDYL